MGKIARQQTKKRNKDEARSNGRLRRYEQVRLDTKTGILHFPKCISNMFFPRKYVGIMYNSYTKYLYIVPPEKVYFIHNKPFTYQSKHRDFLFNLINLGAALNVKGLFTVVGINLCKYRRRSVYLKAEVHTLVKEVIIHL